MKLKWLFIYLIISTFLPLVAFAFDRGIYINSDTAENTKKMDYLIKQAKADGIDTFVIDVYNRSKLYTKNVTAVKENGFKYIARVVVFPYGGTPSDVRSQAVWEKRWQWAKYAIELGASAIQLDYIRFKPSQPLSENNVHEINKVVKFFKNKLANTNVKLQIDVFGITALGPSKRIGHDVGIFSQTVDAICPMVYPSHYEPFRVHAVKPYEAVLELIEGVKKQIKEHPGVSIYPFIELYNYRYPLSHAEKIRYIQAEIKAVKDADVSGWYAWNDANHYDLLFEILKDSQSNVKQPQKN